MLRLAFFLLLLVLTAGPALSASPFPQLEFADALYAEGDYYRAITEYKRFLFENPNAREGAHARLRIARSYLAGERWTEAEDHLQRLQQDWPASAEARRGALLYAEIPFRRGLFAQSRERYRLIPGDYPQQAPAAGYRIAWTYIEEGSYQAARQQLAELQLPQAGQLATDLSQLEQLKEKSPLAAGLLSAALPGAGQLYAGRPRDAGISFALNAAFILAAIEAFDNDNEVLGGILLFCELGWYSGNIYNAVSNAHKHNRDQRREQLQQLRNQHGLDLRLDRHAALVEYRLRF